MEGVGVWRIAKVQENNVLPQTKMQQNIFTTNIFYSLHCDILKVEKTNAVEWSLIFVNPKIATISRLHTFIWP